MTDAIPNFLRLIPIQVQFHASFYPFPMYNKNNMPLNNVKIISKLNNVKIISKDLCKLHCFNCLFQIIFILILLKVNSH